MFGAFHVRRIVPFVLAAVFTLLLLPALLIAAQEPTPTATPPQPPGTPLPWVTEPAVTGARLASTPIPASPFELLFTNSFDDENYTANFWTLGAGWEQSSSGGRGQMLEVSGSDASVTFVHDTILDAAVQARFLVSAGAVRLNLRQSAAGAYTVTLTADGIVMLTRGADLLGMAPSTVAPNTWHTIRLSALGGAVEVIVDGMSVIAVQDSAPLPAGTISFVGQSLGVASLLVDDFVLEVQREAFTGISTEDTLPEMPALTLIQTEDFEGRPPEWVYQSTWEMAFIDTGLGIEVFNDSTPLVLMDEPIFNVAVDIAFSALNTGTSARLQVRLSRVWCLHGGIRLCWQRVPLSQ